MRPLWWRTARAGGVFTSQPAANAFKLAENQAT